MEISTKYTMKTEEHRKVEAVLFAVGKEMTAEEVGRLCNLGEQRAAALLHDLHNDYEQNIAGALTLQHKDKFWKFTVKDAYLPLVTSLVHHTDLDKSVMETLAVIAWRYPIVQADLIKIRHNKAYEHLKLLEEREFVAKEKFGRTYRIKLTPKFFDYFDLPSQDAKEAFKKVIPPEIQKEITRTEQEIDLKEKEIEERETKKVKQAVPEKSDEEKAQEAADEVEAELK